MNDRLVEPKRARSRWPHLAILCVLASLLVPGTVSAHSATGAENRLWAFDLAEQVHVGGAASLTLELHQGYGLADYDFASGSLLAARGGGRSIWSSTKSKSAVKNAFGHWKKYGGEFPEFQNAKQYVEGANRFVIDGRIRNLEKQIENFRNQINQAGGGG